MSTKDPFSFLNSIFDYGIDVAKRRVFLQCAIEEPDTPGKSVAEQVTRGLLFLDSLGKEKEDIELWINTPGGSVPDMFGIYDIIQSCECNISTVGHGCVASAGALILAGGSKGKRLATENTFFMVHEYQSGYEGGVKELEIFAKQINIEEERWAKLMGHATKEKKKSAKFWLDTIRNEKEFWLDAKGMIQYGIIDGIY